MSRRNISIIKYVLFAALVPIAILLFIFVANLIYEYTGFYINVTDIYNKELVAFAGSFFGAVAILVAVLIVIKHFNNEAKHESYTKLLDKEKEYIYNALSKINPLAAINIYNQYSVLPVDTDDYKRVQVIEIRRDINSLREQLMLARTELYLKTDILDVYDKCTNCPKKCNIIKYSERFQKQYSEAEKIIYNFLINLDQYIDIDSTNSEYLAIIDRLNRQLETPRITASAKEELTAQIAKYEAAMRDAEVLIGDLVVDMTTISQIHLELKVKLIHTAKGYYFAKLRDEYNSYMRVKSYDTDCRR